jgi:riboflavin synthase
MFTGIIKGLFPISQVHKKPGMIQYSVTLPPPWFEGLEIGASISIDGVCQSVVRTQGTDVWFDAIEETLQKTTLNDLKSGQRVNVERSAKFSDEIGGHILSGHVYGKAKILKIETWENNKKITFQCENPEWSKYLFSKGYIAIDGASLTLVDVNPPGTFSVHLIPETLRATTLGQKTEGDRVNLEFDSQTLTIVETVERILSSRQDALKS